MLSAVLDSAGFSGQKLIDATGSADVKEQLKVNTARFASSFSDDCE